MMLKKFVPTVLAAMLALCFVSSPALAQITNPVNDPVVKNLINLGLATATKGKVAAGLLVDPTTVVGGTTQNADNTLNTLSLDDEWLSRPGRGALIAAWGITAANANAKDIKLFLGSTAIATITDSTASGKDFAIVAVLNATGNDAQSGFAVVLVDGAVVAASSINFTATEDSNSALTIKTTGNNNAAAASAATGKGLMVIPLG